MTCDFCGAPLVAGAMLCGECGNAVPTGIIPAPEKSDSPRDTVVIPAGPREVIAELPAWADAADDFSGAAIERPAVIPQTSDQHDRFVLQFSTGERVTVYGAGLLGRGPVAQPGEFFDVLVAISDPGRSVSKTHLSFGQNDGWFWVNDRFSANGTVVREPDVPARRCEPGKRYRVARGARVDVGDQFFILS